MCLRIDSNSVPKTVMGDYRVDLLNELDLSYRKLYKTVANFNKKKAVLPIDRAQLEHFPLMVWVEINPEVTVRKRKNRFGNYLCFDTKMQRGGGFGEHFHDDMIESTEVVSGELLETSTNVVYTSGDVAHYEKGLKHTPIALTDCFLHVLFKP